MQQCGEAGLALLVLQRDVASEDVAVLRIAGTLRTAAAAQRTCLGVNMPSYPKRGASEAMVWSLSSLSCSTSHVKRIPTTESHHHGNIR